MALAKLKPWPFCGKKAILAKYQEFDGGNAYQVYCPDEVIRVHTEKEAIEVWNRRADND